MFEKEFAEAGNFTFTFFLAESGKVFSVKAVAFGKPGIKHSHLVSITERALRAVFSPLGLWQIHVNWGSLIISEPENWLRGYQWFSISIC